jgi:hypothetical protein
MSTSAELASSHALSPELMAGGRFVAATGAGGISAAKEVEISAVQIASRENTAGSRRE